MALVEFGSRAYVITPFTSDYDNLLLSMSLIGDPVEFSTFPNPARSSPARSRRASRSSRRSTFSKRRAT